MKKNTRYFQCTLSRGTGRQVAYIEERGAKVGNKVEILEGSNSFWNVDSVSNKSVDGIYLKDLQDYGRNSLPSIL